MRDSRIKDAVGRLGLSVRESEIVECLSCGMDTREMAKVVGRSTHTVRTHLRKIFMKLSINSRAELMARVLINVLEDVDSVGPSEAGTPAVESEAAVGAEPHAVPSR